MFNEKVRNVMFDLGTNREIFDAETNRVISKDEANDVIKKACFEFLGLTEKSTNKEIKRALDPHSDRCKEFFAVIEEIIDTQIAYGLSENEFFNEYVETKNMKDGDVNEFWVDDEVLLTVSKVNGEAHNLSMQRLGAGQSYHVDTAVYGIKVGENIRQFLIGRKNWADFVDAVVKAYINKVQTLIASQFANGVNIISVPSVLTGTGALSSSTKAAFDAIIEKVGAANNSSVVIMGTKTALKNLTALTTIDWASPAASIKEAVANTGIIGNYEGTPLMEIPQKFTDKTLATPIVDNSKIYIMPAVENKFIKFVDYGESELEVNEKGATKDDMQSYEVMRRMGVSTLMTRYFGIWTI
jgi:hypothetical protein